MKKIFRVCNVLWLMAASQLAVQVQAKTVAWYRFDESAPGGRTTSQSVITNFADSSALSGSPMVAAMPYGGKQKTAYEPEDRMPSYVEAYPSSLSVFDPISGISHLNAAALFCSNTAATAFTPASIVLVEDDERLHLDSMTIECFLKVPPVPAGSTWLSVLTRDYDASGKLAYGLRLMATGHLAFYVTTKDESGAATQTQYARAREFPAQRWPVRDSA